MTKQKNLEASAAIDGSKLWDEILKAIVSVMPSQLFPLFMEVYGREYPKDTPIIVLSSETSSFLENDAAPPRSTFMDISLLVAGTDYYHLQFRMVFQDNSEHIYKVPTVKVQTYSLEEIRRKHLTLFIPYTILRLRPMLAPNIEHKLTNKELAGCWRNIRKCGRR